MKKQNVKKELSEKELKEEIAKLEKEIEELNKEDNYKLESILEEQCYIHAYENAYKFLVHSWHTFETVDFIQSKHLYAIGEHLDACVNGDIKNLIINIPPRSSKTSLVTRAFPAYLWIKLPKFKIINVSYSHSLAEKDSLTSRLILQSDWYKKGLNTVWKELSGDNYLKWELRKDSNKKYDYENTVGGGRFATSPEGTFTGKGGDIILVDDPLNANDAKSKTKRDSVNDWLSFTFSTRLNDKEKGIRILIMQRLHEDDCVGYLLGGSSNWELLKIPMEFEESNRYWTSIGWTDWRIKDNELMCEKRFNRNVVEELKVELKEYGYAAQMQQNPTPLGGGLIKDIWWKTYYIVPNLFDCIVISMDLNTKKGMNNDNTSLMVLGRKGSLVYILDLVYKNMDIVDQLKEIKKLCEKWSMVKVKLIEDKSNGSAVWSMLKNNIPGLIPVDPKGLDKESRINAIIPYIEAGNVHIPDKDIDKFNFINPLLKEATMFPKGKHDDALDSLAYGLDYLLNNNVVTHMPIEIITESENVVSRKNIKDYILESNYGYTVDTNREYIKNLFN